jgi:hypothetical protein
MKLSIMKDIAHQATHAALIASSTILLNTASASPIKKEVIGQSDGTSEVYRLIHGSDGEAAWNEIDAVNKTTKEAKILAQDEILFTNEKNSGGDLIPMANKIDLSNIYARYVIGQAGGIEKYRDEMSRCQQYGIPEPTGLLKSALDKLGALSYDSAPKTRNTTEKSDNKENKSHSIDFN